jgi:hypothetical protein
MGRKVVKGENIPSISNVLPIVFFHSFPAIAILRSLSSSGDFRSSGGSDADVELIASSIPFVGPLK